jgi:tetratricopeptide (TPR) repeat protein
MAIYMLFHIFILFFLFVRSNVTLHKSIYVLLSILLSITLLFTGTRGTFLGLIAGFGVMIGYVALFGRAYPELRRVAVIACVAVVLLFGGFFAIKDTPAVQENTALSRIANISLENDLVIREKIWTMAWTGFKERPLLGWGQSNFNYVFNQEYDPSLFAAEAWYDRTHNITFDWLITGGIFGLLAYLSIFVAALYYLFWQPLFSKSEATFNVLERSVLIGLLAGYFVHNLVVFDNIISYIFFGAILALVHSSVSVPIERVKSFKLDEQLIGQFVTPLVVLIAVATVYFVNVPGIGAAGDIIDAMVAPTAKGRLEEFHSALSRNSFAQQEIVEQLAQQAMNVIRNPNASEEEKQAMVGRAELELLALAKDKPGDARLHSFLTTFYRTIGATPEARTQSALARSFSPKKQAIIIEQGIVEIQGGDIPKALEYLKEAFTLDERNTQARIFYATTLISSGKKDEGMALIGEEYFGAFAQNDYALSVVDQSKDMTLLARMFETRVALQPQNAQNRATLAFIYSELKQNEKAIAILEKAGSELPEFKERADCFVGNLKKGAKPDVGCN